MVLVVCVQPVKAMCYRATMRDIIGTSIGVILGLVAAALILGSYWFIGGFAQP